MGVDDFFFLLRKALFFVAIAPNLFQFFNEKVMLLIQIPHTAFPQIVDTHSESALI